MENKEAIYEIVYDVVGSSTSEYKLKCRKCGEITVFTKENISNYCCGKCGIKFKNSVPPGPMTDPARRPNWN